MPLDDSDPKKWKMKAHTEVKHQILRKYLTAWTRIVSSGNPELHYFDGFAGRARYENGERGSPLLALDVANRHTDQFDVFHCTFNDLDDSNYNNLKQEVEEYKSGLDKPEKIQENIFNEPFEEIALPVLRSDSFQSLPSMVFIDPFGYSGTPFEVISEIMNLQDSGNEVFFNLMVDKIRRFLTDPEKEETITTAFGTDEWKDIRNIREREEQEEEILKLYVTRLQEVADVDYVFPFQMKHPDKDVILYYLIHATNHFKGLKVMKDVMFNEGANDLFAFLGADHYGYEEDQTTLFESTATEDTRVSELQDRLLTRYEDSTVLYQNILKFTYLHTDLIEKHCDGALRELEKRDKISVDRGDSTRGFNREYPIKFKPENKRLSDFC
jgi:three-Cys-motif partner protein